MKTFLALGRVAALGSSTFLFGSYVYYHAGGDVGGWIAHSDSVDAVDAVEPAATAASQQIETPVLFPGSKSYSGTTVIDAQDSPLVDRVAVQRDSNPPTNRPPSFSADELLRGTPTIASSVPFAATQQTAKPLLKLKPSTSSKSSTSVKSVWAVTSKATVVELPPLLVWPPKLIRGQAQPDTVLNPTPLPEVPYSESGTDDGVPIGSGTLRIAAPRMSLKNEPSLHIVPVPRLEIQR